MNFLRWLGGIVVFFWLIGVIFRLAGNLIHLLLLVAAAIFIYDRVFKKPNSQVQNKQH
ncbi:MAG: hypothetical protein BWY15_01545 [Firmicutes bacterium ADurb.Bin193]|nr:MAG: hypothetical protein BWY15_01545 [Firmicutes bacterium ADurb.Bin193]